MQESKWDITKIISLVKMAEYLPSYPIPLNFKTAECVECCSVSPQNVLTKQNVIVIELAKDKTYNKTCVTSKSCADAQADLSIRWSHKSYCRLCGALAQLLFALVLHVAL